MHSPHSRRESCNLSPRRKYKITSINYLELFCRDVSFMPHFIIHLYWFEPIDIYFAFCIINPILYFVAQTVLALAIENSLCGILSPCTVGCVLCVCVCMAVYTCASQYFLTFWYCVPEFQAHLPYFLPQSQIQRYSHISKESFKNFHFQ